MPAERRLSVELDPITDKMMDYLQYKRRVSGDKEGARYRAITMDLIVAEFDKRKDPEDKAVIEIEALRAKKAEAELIDN